MDKAKGELRFQLGFNICVKFGVNFYFAVEVKFWHAHNLLLSWKPHDLEMGRPTTNAFYIDSQPFYEIEVVSTNYNIVQHASKTFLKNSSKTTHKYIYIYILIDNEKFYLKSSQPE